MVRSWKAGGFFPGQRNGSVAQAKQFTGVKLGELIEYAMEKGCNRERASHFATSFQGYWAGKKWIKNGKLIDWKIEFGANLAKWREKELL